MIKNSLYTVITGASAGLGKEMAIECAKRNMNLILASLSDTGLKEFSEKLKNQYNINAFYFTIDFRENNTCEQFYKWIAKQGLSVNILINSSGLIAVITLFSKLLSDTICV